VSAEDVRVSLLAMASFQRLPPAQAAAAISRLADLILAGLAAGAAVGTLKDKEKVLSGET
jgi:hypothetical protein